MAMKKIKCPHCGKSKGPYAVNENTEMSRVHVICSSCHKPFVWQGIFGKVVVEK